MNKSIDRRRARASLRIFGLAALAAASSGVVASAAHAQDPYPCMHTTEGHGCPQDGAPMAPVDWVYENFQFAGHGVVSGWDFYVRNDGGTPTAGQAAKLQDILGYSSCWVAKPASVFKRVQCEE